MRFNYVLLENLKPKYRKYLERKVQSHMDNMSEHLNANIRQFRKGIYRPMAMVLARKDLIKMMNREKRRDREQSQSPRTQVL